MDGDTEQNEEAFLADFATMSLFGATADGGVDRQAATPADIEQRRWLAGVLETHGFRVEYDRIANQFGLLELVPGAPYVVVGSHMDSQPTAGKFDGAYGVLAAAHAAFRIRSEWMAGAITPRFNLAVVNWFNEEGSRFTPSMMGSSVYTGKMPLNTALAVRDRSGVTVGQALEQTGFLGATDGPRPAYAAEIHIEQGRLLENASLAIGLVTASWSASKYRIVVHGEQSHSGATVMEDRRDALLGASMLVVAARRLADRFAGTLHTAIGQLDVYPNSPVVVASRVTLLLDLRSADENVLEEANSALESAIAEIERDAAVTIERELSHSWGINPYQPAGVELSRHAAESLGLAYGQIMTVAGHDSINMKDVVPTVMLFVPSVNGVSHNEGEYTKDADLIAGLHVLTEVTRRLVSGELTSAAEPGIERQNP